MTRTLTKATQEDINTVALFLYNKEVTPEQAIVWLKQKHYRIQGKVYQATYVANVMQGLYLADQAIKQGKAKCTKKLELQFQASQPK